MPTDTRPNARLERAGVRIQREIAPLVTMLLARIHTEMYDAATGTTPSSGAGRITGGAMADPTANSAAQLDHWIDVREELRDRLDGLLIGVHGFDGWLRKQIGPGARAVAPLCDGSATTAERKAWEGHQLVWTPGSRDERNGWHKPECREAAGTSGLCATCLLRMNRWRARNGLDWVSERRDDAA